jgi:hypothetical protein
VTRLETAVPMGDAEITEVATSHEELDVGTIAEKEQVKEEPRRTRSGRTSKPRDVLTFASSASSSHTFRKKGLPLTLLLLAAAIGLTHIFRSHDPMQTAEALERQAVTGLDQDAIETVQTIEDEIGRVDYSGLTAAAKEQFKKIQALDMLSSLNGENREDDDAWDAVAVLKHSRRNLRDDDVHTKIKALWKNGEKSWVRMDAMQIDDPLMLVAYAHANHLTNQSDWRWVKEYASTESEMEAITRVYKASSKSDKRMKFGVEVPQGMKAAMRLDAVNGNTLWRDALKKELQQINDYRTFRLVDENEFLPDDYQRVPYHFVWDVKFDLRRKCRLVAGGNWTDPPKEDVYSGVVSMDTIRMGFMLSQLNGLQVCAADVGNAFLYGITSERVYIIAGPEFGELQGRKLVIHKGLYGLRTSAARFHEHLAQKLTDLGFTPSRADPNLWLRDRGDHYDYAATYVDDLLIFSRECMEVIKALKKDYILKGVGEPEFYLGGNVEILDETWQKEEIFVALSARTYVENAAEKVEVMLDQTLRQFKSPMEESYHPELDTTDVMPPLMASRFRTMIGMANWMIVLGRFDIAYATMALSRYNMEPRYGHLKALIRVFGYLKRYSNGRILVDTKEMDLSAYPPTNYDTWSHFYPGAEEDLPKDMPIPKGKAITIVVYVDADHAHDQVTRRSVTGILLFINGMPIRWVSKRQKTVETSTYSSEMVAGRIAVELVIEYRYNLRMLGVPIDGPAAMLGDNMSVILSTTVPSSALKKKHNSVAYHRIREAVAGGLITFAHVESKDNYADILTKPLPNDAFLRLVKPLLFRLPFGRFGAP